MTATLDYRPNVLARTQHGRQHDDISTLGILSLWVVVGLALTGLTFALGFGSEAMQALAVAG